MARPRSGALSSASSDLPLETLRGEDWIAIVHAPWRKALTEAGWLARAPLEKRTPAASLGVEPRKHAGRGDVYRVSLEPGPALLRPVRHGGWLAPLLGPRLAGPGRPFAELRATASLWALGAPVPEPVMALAWRSGGPLWRALVATRELPDTLDGHAFLSIHPSRAAVHAALVAAGGALRHFHDTGGRHRDLNLGNLLLKVADPPDTSATRVWVIDLDGARVGAPPSPRRRLGELMRLYRSLRKRGGGDCARLAAGLFRSYCAGDRALRAHMLRWRRLEEMRVAVHALRYPS